MSRRARCFGNDSMPKPSYSASRQSSQQIEHSADRYDRQYYHASVKGLGIAGFIILLGLGMGYAAMMNYGSSSNPSQNISRQEGNLAIIADSN